MKINRYIKNPLIFALTLAILYQLTHLGFFYGFVVGAISGLVLQLYSDYKTRQINENTSEEDFNPHQKENLVLFYHYEKTFNLCLESIPVLDDAEIVSQDYSTGIIEVKTGTIWSGFRNTVTFKIRKLTDFSTEIEVYAKPLIKTAQIDYGNGLKIIRLLGELFQAQNDKINLKILEEKTEIPINLNTELKEVNNVFNKYGLL